MTGALLLTGRALLAVIFAVAAMSKLADRRGFRAAVRDFGVGARLGPVIAWTIPALELATSALLVGHSTARWGALTALVVLTLFSIAIAGNLMRHRRPHCRCFGAQRGPIGPGALIRNAALASVAVVVVTVGWRDPGPDALAWTAHLSGMQWALVVAATWLIALTAGTAMFTIALLRQHGRLLLRLDALEAIADAGTLAEPVTQPTNARHVAPRFVLSALDGSEQALAELLAPARRLVLVFVSAHCPACEPVVREFRDWRADDDAGVAIRLIASGDGLDSDRWGDAGDPYQVAIDPDLEVTNAFGIRGTPSALVVEPDGFITHPLAEGADAVRDLVRTALGRRGKLTVESRRPSPSAYRLRDAERASAEHA